MSFCLSLCVCVCVELNSNCCNKLNKDNNVAKALHASQHSRGGRRL